MALIVLVISVAGTAAAFWIRLPRTVFAGSPIGRPIDLGCGFLFALVLLVFLREYRLTRDRMTWWLALAIGVNAVAEIVMSFSRDLYDPFFNVAHVYKVLGYAAPLLGFSFYQLATIVEVKRVEGELRDSESRLRQIIDLVPHIIFAKDRTGRFIMVNRALASAYGTTTEKLIGARDADFHPGGKEVEHFLQNDMEVIRNGESKFVPEETLIDADGRRHILQTTKIPFVTSRSAEPAVLGVAIDITELKRAEEELAPRTTAWSRMCATGPRRWPLP